MARITNTYSFKGAPYSRSNTIAVLEAYDLSFREGAVLWRTTNRPWDALNYRFYSRRPTDLIRIAVNAGFIKSDNSLARLLQAWSSPYDGRTPEQSCDFDAAKGLTKAWVYMAGFRHLDEILGVDSVPESIRQHANIFRELDLQLVRHVAVDFHSDTVNLYFRVVGPLSKNRAAAFTKLVGASPPEHSDFLDMCNFLDPTGFTFAVTIAFNTGDIERVAFYALGLPSVPREIGDRLAAFFKEVPSYDAEEFIALAWSYGAGGKNYVKAEKSYCGELVPLLRDWKSNLTADGK